MPVATAGRPVLRRRVAVMGSAAEITLVLGDGAGAARDGAVAADRVALERAVARLQDLEARWSRFLPDSEISRLNAVAGRPRRVSADTALLIDLAQRGWRATAGRYDPTLLAVVRSIGYDRDFARLPAQRPALPAAPPHDPGTCGRIVVDRAGGSVCLPAGAAFDPGGIGKGLAADLVSADLAAAGIAGGCVNVGGDLRVWGAGPHGPRWQVGAAGRTLALTDAAVATSGTERRAWTAAGRRVHHLIDPATLAPADRGVTAATVVAPAAWRAEVYALAAVSRGVPGALADLRCWGVEGLVVAGDGAVHATPRLRVPA